MARKGGSFNLERFKIDNLYATYLGMTTREQTMALIVGLAVVLLVIILPLMVASRSIGSLEKNIEDGKVGLKQIMHEIESYNASRAELEALQSQLAGGFDSSIATTLEGLATKLGMKEKIDSLKEKAVPPSDLYEQAAVDVRLTRVRLEELIAMLVEVENNPEKILKLSQLEIKPRYDSKQELDVSFTVSTFKLSATGEATE